MRVAREIIIVVLSIISSVSCMTRGGGSVDFSKVTLDDMMATCFWSDDAGKLELLLDQGLPIDNYYNYFDSENNSAGNSRRMRRRDSNGLLNNSNPLADSTTLLLQALQSRSLNCVKLLIARHADVSLVDSKGNNALMMAADLPENSVLSIAKELCSLSVFDLNATNGDNDTALGLAVRRNNGAYVRWLLENGADCNVTNSVESGFASNSRPILFDALNARKDIFELFMSNPKIQVSVSTCFSEEILMRLNPCIEDYEGRFKRLMAAGAKFGESTSFSNVLIKNMAKMGDCPKRISMICSFTPDQAILKGALKFARRRNYAECIDVIESCLKSERKE